MTEWITPKTDWKVTYDDETGAYVGDYFNLEDCNRLQNNIIVLYERCKILYGGNDLYDPTYPLSPSVGSLIPSGYFANIAEFLNMYCYVGAFITFEEYTYFVYLQGGDAFPNYEKLNSLEKTMLLCYERMNEFIANRRQFKWRLGIEGGTKKWV